MSDPILPPDPGTPAPLSSHRVIIEFDVRARSRAEANALIQEVLVEELAGPPEQIRTDGDRVFGEDFGDDVAHIRSWTPPPAASAPPRTVAVPSLEWEPFEDSGIPEIVAEMFPPEPERQNHLRPDGSVDEDSLSAAYEDWRDECLTLAFQAARLPEILRQLEDLENVQERSARVTQAEQVRDAVIDLLERDPLPLEPRRKDYLVTIAPSFEGEFEDMRFAWDHSQWRSDFTAAAKRHDHALRDMIAEGGPRTTYLPEQFHREWIPADLVALYKLRSIVDAEHPGLGVPIEPKQSEMLEALLAASDPEIRVTDPDDPAGVELYAGPASEAHDWLPPGVYEATGPEGTGEFRLVIGSVPAGDDVTASAAFPVAEHDSAVLGEIARILEHDAELHDPQAVLARVNAAIERTGRIGALPTDLDRAPEPLTRLERGTLLNELLAEREQHLDTPSDGSEPRSPGTGPERNL